MKTDRLSSYIPFSIGLHSLLVIASVLYVMFAGAHYKATTFEVALVDSSAGSPSPAAAQKTAEAQPAPETKNTHMTEKSEKVTTKEKTEVNERIAALEAKRKIEAMAKLRQAITISKSNASATNSNSSGRNVPGGSANYGQLVSNKLHKCWNLPDSIDKDLMAVINIHVSRSGNVTIGNFVKKSNNIIFDKAVLRAITSCAPVPPPANETDIEITFTP